MLLTSKTLNIILLQKKILILRKESNAILFRFNLFKKLVPYIQNIERDFNDQKISNASPVPYEKILERELQLGYYFKFMEDLVKVKEEVAVFSQRCCDIRVECTEYVLDFFSASEEDSMEKKELLRELNDLLALRDNLALELLKIYELLATKV